MMWSWSALALVVVTQLGSDLPENLPERLPPVPGDLGYPPPAAQTYSMPAQYQPSVVPQPFPPAAQTFGPGHAPSFSPGAAPPIAYSPILSPPAQYSASPNLNGQVTPLGLPPPPDSYVAPAVYGATNGAPLQAFDPPAWDEPELPGTRLSFCTLGAGTGFNSTTFDINHTWLFGYGDEPPLNITPGFGMHFWGDGMGIGLPARVYDVYVDLQWTAWTGELWSVAVGLTPGLYSDFNQAGSNMFQLTGWIVANRPLNEAWQLVLGAAYVRQLQSTLVPVGGLIWTPDADRRIELIFPKPKYAVRFHESGVGSRWWFVAGQLGGGAWSVADGPNDDALVGYSDLRLLFGVESFRVDGREWTLEAGYAFNRELTIDNRVVAYPGSTFSLAGSLAF